MESVDQEQAESDGVNERLAKLAEFQVSVIRHAFKCKVDHDPLCVACASHSHHTILFLVPKAKRVVYSTCSIHPQENEHVVRTILADNPDFELASRDSVLPTWTRRGVPKEFADSNNNDVATGKSPLSQFMIGRLLKWYSSIGRFCGTFGSVT